ncbi:MAG: hypothetical protein ACK2UK_04335 [Candidatus Promineifilaceae bacterium]
MMVERKITFYNKTAINVQAQVYAGRTLVSTCVADPGETCFMSAKSLRYDVFFKNAATGWEIARKLDSDTKDFALSQDNGRYTIHEADSDDRIASGAEAGANAAEVVN